MIARLLFQGENQLLHAVNLGLVVIYNCRVVLDSSN